MQTIAGQGDVALRTFWLVELASIGGPWFLEGLREAFDPGIPLQPIFWKMVTRYVLFKTTMIYTHVLNQGGRGMRSPADFLGTAIG